MRQHITCFRLGFVVVLGVLLSGAGRAADPKKPSDKYAEQREILRKEVLSQSGVDVTRWAEDVPNPFTNLTPAGKTKLKATGIDVDRLSKLKAVLLTGNYCGACSKRFVNRDPNTIVILGKGFITHERVYSVGPVLAVEDAHIMGSLTGADLVWFVEKSFPRFQTVGAPLLAGPDTFKSHDRETAARLVKDAFGWRRPDDFLKILTLKPGAKLPPLAAADAYGKRTTLTDRIKRQTGTDTAEWCESVVNPFKNLAPDGKAKLRARGIDTERLAKCKAVLLQGEYCGANMKTFINRDPETILIIGKGFITHGEVFSLGPVLGVENAHFMGNVTGADLVWMTEKSFPRGRTTGLPVILAASAEHSQMRPGCDDIWYGDYGWRRDTDFLKPAPVTLTRKELDALWTDLPGNDADRTTRVLRKLVAGSTHTLDYFKEKLRVDPTPDEKLLARLIADLDHDDFAKREAASKGLEKMGLSAVPALERAIKSGSSLELRRRAEEILSTCAEDRRRIQRALSALEQIGTPAAQRLLTELHKANPASFLGQEAQRVLKRLEEKTKP